MKILVLNSGSSSVKFQLIDAATEVVAGKGVVERIGSSDAISTYEPKGRNKIREIREILNHETAIELVLSLLLHPQHGVIKEKNEIDGIGHRVVHGGEKFSGSVLITEKVKAALRECSQFAPLHNPPNLKGIEACESLLPGIPQVGVFDTAFHHTIPPKAYLYGLPFALYKKLGIRRYGFHGTSHRYVAQKAAEIIGRPLEKLNVITCHLGNGASITAIAGGKSVDTTMGFTPLEGLVMGTRCGDIDPALIPYIMEKENLTTKQIDSIMNKNSGMLGLTETSNDMREIEAEAFRGSEQHRLALDVYCHRVKKYIGAYMAVLGGADGIVFTGGVGEKSSYVREIALKNMASFGIRIDLEKNNKNAVEIGTGKVKVLVIPTNEELAIARDTRSILESIEEIQTAQIPEEVVQGQLALLTDDDKAELVLLWAKNPRTNIVDLTQKLNEKIHKDIQVQTVKRELEILGLQRISENKKNELVN
ncbi:MAG: acetate kinase [bacterium]